MTLGMEPNSEILNYNPRQENAGAILFVNAQSFDRNEYLVSNSYISESLTWQRACQLHSKPFRRSEREPSRTCSGLALALKPTCPTAPE